MTSADNQLDKLVTYWTNESLKLNSGTLTDNINLFEDQFELKFSDSFINYLKRTNGFVDFDSDSAWFSFWSIDRMKEENSNGHHPNDVIWFSDYSINLCSFGFHKSDGKVYTHYQTTSGIILIADTFEKFIDLYLADPYQLLR